MSNFDTYFYPFLAVLGSPWGPLNRLKTTWRHPYGTPILAPKAILLRSGPRGCDFRQFWLPKRQFLKDLLIIFLIFLGSLSAAAMEIARNSMSDNSASCKTQKQQQQKQQQLTCETCDVLQHLVLQIAAAAAGAASFKIKSRHFKHKWSAI